MARARKRKRGGPAPVLPLPEAVTDAKGGWHVQPIRPGATPAVQFGRGTADNILAAPITPGDAGRRARLQAMAAAKWSPQRVKGLGAIAANLYPDCEAGRLAMRLRYGDRDLARTIADIRLRSDADDAAALALMDTDPAALAAILTGVQHTADHVPLRDAIEESGHPWADTVIAEAAQASYMIEDHGPSKAASATRAAEYLAEVFANPEDEDGTGEGQAAGGYGADADHRDAAERDAAQMAGGGRSYDGDGGDDPDDWTPVTVDYPPRPRTLPARLMSSVRAPKKTGASVKYMARLATDGRIFSASRPGRGGTVLIDISGSMHLDGAGVLALMVGMPAGMIAVYEGSHPEARLTVVAKNGRRVNDDVLEPKWGGNECDGPALEWLAQQPGPRYWVSDGGVVAGATGDSGGRARRYCARIMRRGAIRRIPSADAMVGLLRGEDL